MIFIYCLDSNTNSTVHTYYDIISRTKMNNGKSNLAHHPFLHKCIYVYKMYLVMVDSGYRNKLLTRKKPHQKLARQGNNPLFCWTTWL